MQLGFLLYKFTISIKGSIDTSVRLDILIFQYIFIACNVTFIYLMVE
jgi:hypothetical protein